MLKILTYRLICFFGIVIIPYSIAADESHYSVIYSYEDGKNHMLSGKTECSINKICKLMLDQEIDIYLNLKHSISDLYFSIECARRSCILDNGRSSKFILRTTSTMFEKIYEGKATTGLEWPIKELIGGVYIRIIK